MAALLAGVQSAADAQVINRCRIDGRLVIQSSPCPLDPPMHVSSSTSTTPAEAAPSGPKKKTLADVLRERDGAQRPQPVAREAQGDGANILRSRMGAV